MPRINKALALTGYCSRRQAEELIQDGRVRLNGKRVDEFAVEVDLDTDVLEVDGVVVLAKERTYLAIYKPVGIITTVSDDQGRHSVIDLLPPKFKHLKPVGRLDKDSEGLLILTNDGDFAQKLTHPSHKVWKTYYVEVKGQLKESHVKKLESGIQLSEGKTLPSKVFDLSNHSTSNISATSFNISISEGRNRQIRRMCAQLGFPVTRLVRVAIGRLQLKPMVPGKWRILSKQEITSCFQDHGKTQLKSGNTKVRDSSKTTSR